MHVLGEPVGRQIVPDAARLGLAVDDGAHGRELIAEPDIVDEAGHVGSGLAALDPADDELWQGRKLLEVDLPGERPAAALDLLLDHDALGGDMDRAWLVPMDHDVIGALDRL